MQSEGQSLDDCMANCLPSRAIGCPGSLPTKPPTKGYLWLTTPPQEKNKHSKLPTMAKKRPLFWLLDFKGTGILSKKKGNKEATHWATGSGCDFNRRPFRNGGHPQGKIHPTSLELVPHLKKKPRSKDSSKEVAPKQKKQQPQKT